MADSIFRSKFFRLVLGLCVGAALLYLSTRDVSWQDMKGELETVGFAWIALALLLYWIELGLRVMRWLVLLSQLKPPLPGQHIAMAFFSGYAANNVLPAKLGEAFRADLLGRLADTSRLTAFGSIIVERLFDMVVILAMTAWGVWFATTAHQDPGGGESWPRLTRAPHRPALGRGVRPGSQQKPVYQPAGCRH